MPRWSQFDLDNYNAKRAAEREKQKEKFRAVIKELLSPESLRASTRSLRQQIKWLRSSEYDLHDDILEICRSKGYQVVHSRLDRPTTSGVGTPDFVIALPQGKTLWIEAKTGKGKLTTAQAAWIAALGRLGHDTAIVRSLDQFRSLLP